MSVTERVVVIAGGGRTGLMLAGELVLVDVDVDVDVVVAARTCPAACCSSSATTIGASLRE